MWTPIKIPLMFSLEQKTSLSHRRQTSFILIWLTWWKEEWRPGGFFRTGNVIRWILLVFPWHWSITRLLYWPPKGAVKLKAWVGNCWYLSGRSQLTWKRGNGRAQPAELSPDIRFQGTKHITCSKKRLFFFYVCIYLCRKIDLFQNIFVSFLPN